MNAEQARNIAQTAIADLETALKAGRSEELTAYLNAMGRFHRYSFTNLMLILSQRPTATHVAGFKAWKKLNRYVKKGEKSITIIAPVIRRGDDDDEVRKVRGFRAARVFDIAQTDGEPLPEPLEVTGDPGPYTERMVAVYDQFGITLEVVEDLGRAMGRSSGGRVEIQAGLAPAEHFQVLVHELAHERLHHVERDARPEKAIRELEAEAVAAVVSSAIGLDSLRSAADYIHLYNGDLEMFSASMVRIQRTASTIIEALTNRDQEAA